MHIIRKTMALMLSATMTISALPALSVKAAENTAPLAPRGLLTNELENPLNVEEPTFGWIVNDSDENEVQTAYEIVVTDTVTNVYLNMEDKTNIGIISTLDLYGAYKYPESPNLTDYSGLPSYVFEKTVGEN